MDNTELHYVSYDPEEIWKEMMLAYIESGGDPIYPGDEKDMLLRSVQAVLVQVFAGIDAGLRMQTLRYAVHDYLDLMGENRNCLRIEASRAESMAEISFRATGKSMVLPAGTAMTADGERFYELKNDLTHSGLAQVSRVEIICRQAGSAGNGLYANAQMALAATEDAVISIIAVEDATGGNEREEDESYRERIRLHGLASITTGPASQYRSVAMNVSGEILDARALNEGAGQVVVYLIIRPGAGTGAIIDSVRKALSAEDVRPLTDTVDVLEAPAVNYTLNVRYKAEGKPGAEAAMAATVSDYQAWQDQSIGRAFNPDRLMAAMYQAGAERVVWGDGSEFDGGEVEYTEIDPNERCLGTITMEAISP